MALRRSRFSFPAVVLAVIALFGVIAVSGWHNTIVHDEPAHATSIVHDHAPSKRADPDAPIHLLAHAMGQWVAIAGPSAAPAMTAIADRNWLAFDAGLRSGIDPAELLRPPRN